VQMSADSSHIDISESNLVANGLLSMKGTYLVAEKATLQPSVEGQGHTHPSQQGSPNLPTVVNQSTGCCREFGLV
jgi:hypothetical protein